MNNENLESLEQILQIFNFGKVFALFVGIGVLWLLVRALRQVSQGLGNRLSSKRIIIFQLSAVFGFLIYLLGGIFLFYGVLRPSKELLLAMGGSAAVAIGFSLKDLVSSFVAGVILLFDRPFQVGDRVTFGDTYGEIVSIGIRAVRINTLDDNLVTIPNSKFLTDVVASGNSGALDMMIVVPFYVSLEADLKKATSLMREAVVTSRYVFLKKPVSVVASEIAISNQFAVRLDAKAYVLDVKYEKAFQTDLVERIEQRFIENKIQRPKVSIQET